jgi:2-keto-4-pentenoate hydratase/2-oxohepta-3-ene-1,7-dioic acid hydratase in catechol pathway
MKLARVSTANGDRFAAEIEGVWREIAALSQEAAAHPGDEVEVVRFLAPVEPVVLVGLSGNTEAADGHPRIFLKSPRTVVSAGDVIVEDPALGRTLVECELAVVIGRRAERVPTGQGRSAILGWTIANDVTIIEKIGAHGYLAEAKGGIGATPLGPWLETDFDDAAAQLDVFVDGELRASDNLAKLRLRSEALVEWISSFMTLDMGDVILAGATGAIAVAESGQTVSLRIAGLGHLENSVQRAAR